MITKKLITNLLIICSFFFTVLSSNSAFAVLGATPSVAPDQILAGATANLSIVLSNDNETDTITGLTFSSALPGPLPTGLKIVGNITYECKKDGVTQTSGTVIPSDETLIDLPADIGFQIPDRENNVNGECIITVPITAETPNGNSSGYDYTILDAAANGFEGAVPISNSSDPDPIQTVTVLPIAQPEIIKSFNTKTSVNNTVVLNGEPENLTIYIDNLDVIGKASVAINNIAIKDVLPVTIKTVDTTAINVTCPSGSTITLTPNVLRTEIDITGNLVANDSCEISVPIEAFGTASSFRNTVTNTIVKAFTNDIGIEFQDPTSANIRTQSPFEVRTNFVDSAIASGQAGNLKITLLNNGNVDFYVTSFASNLDQFGDDAHGINATAIPTILCSSEGDGGGVYELTGANDSGINQTRPTKIPANGYCVITVPYIGTLENANTPSTFTYNIPVGTITTSDPAIINQGASDSVVVSDSLRILKTASPSNPVPRNPIQYKITVQNWLTTILNNVVVNDDLDDPQTFLTGIVGNLDYTPKLSGSGCGAFDPSDSTSVKAIFKIATIAGRSSSTAPTSCVITFYAMISETAAGGLNISNTVDAGDVTSDEVPLSGGPSNTTTSTVNENVLVATKTFSPESSQEGAVSRMTINLSNLSAEVISALKITDILPSSSTSSGQMKISDPANIFTNCSGASVAIAADRQTITLSGGEVGGRANLGTGAAGTCRLEVDVVASAGVYANRAAIKATENFADGTDGDISQDVSDTMTYTSVLEAEKFFFPTSVGSGGQSRVTVRLKNKGLAALTNVSVEDPLPSGMVLASQIMATTTCGENASFVGNPGGSNIKMTGGTILGGTDANPGSCDVLFNVVEVGNANRLNSIPTGNIAADGNITNQSPVEKTLNFNAAGNVILSKTILEPGSLSFPGETRTLQITLTGEVLDVTNLSLTDYFTLDGKAGSALNGWRIAPDPQSDTNCNGGIISANPNGVSIGISGVNLSVGSSCKITAKVTLKEFGNNNVNNMIPINAVSSSQGVTNDGQVKTSLLASGSDIGITKNFNPGTIKPGQISVLTINLINPNNQIATSTKFIDYLGAIGLKIANNSITNTCVGADIDITSDTSEIKFENGEIPALNGGIPGGCYLQVNVETAAPNNTGDFTNIIPVGGLEAKIGLTDLDNAIAANAVLRVKAPLEIHLAIEDKTLDTNLTNNNNPASFTIETALANVGDVKTMKISIYNPNSTDVTKVSLANLLPEGLTIAQIPNENNGCANGFFAPSASANNFALSGATIPSAGFCTISVDVVSNVSKIYDDNIPASAISSLEGITNEEPTNARVIFATPPVVSKSFDPAVIPAGGTSTLTIFLKNDNSSNITLSSAFTDTLPTSPGAMVVKNPPNISGTCSISDITASAGSATIKYANSAIIPPGGCFIEVDITASISGTYTNRVDAGDLVTSAGNNQQPAIANLSVSPKGFISGQVFKDANADGDFDFGSDTAIEDVEIELRSGVICSGGALVSSSDFSNPIKTDIGGNYLFSGLDSGTYSLCQNNQPAKTINGTTSTRPITQVNSSGGSSGTPSNPTTTTSQIISIALGENGAGEVSGSGGNNFAELTDSLIDLEISKTHTPTSFGEGSTTGIFSISVKNLEAGSTSGIITVTDTLPTGMKIAEITAPSIWNCMGLIGGTSFTCTTSEVFDINSDFAPITLRVSVDSGTLGQTLINQVQVSGGNETIGFESNNKAFDPVLIASSTSVSGSVWKDVNGNKRKDDGDANNLPGWVVQLIFGGNIVQETKTNSSGAYSFNGISPASGYDIRFRNPDTDIIFAGVVTNEDGNSDNPAGANTSKGTLTGLDLSGPAISGQSLPLDPSGVIYNSITRQPVAGVKIQITSSNPGFDGVDLVSGDTVFTTGSNGLYQFFFLTTAPYAEYDLEIIEYPAGYSQVPSNVLPVCTDRLKVESAAINLLVHSDGNPPSTSAVVQDESCPTTNSGVAFNNATTQYFDKFIIDPEISPASPTRSAQILNNHIPIDPASSTSLRVTKTSPLVNVSIGQLVPYQINIENTSQITFSDINIVDTMPAGFKYVEGSASVNGVNQEPIKNSRTLTWSGNNIAPKEKINISMLLVIGSGVQTGKYINRVSVLDSTFINTISNLATATVNVVPDPIFDCSEIIGKVFDDTNHNGYHDAGEVGIPNVRVATVNGLLVTADDYGRFHVACAKIPDSERGSNFIMKLDTRTLPSGYEVSSENPRVVRLTRGKITKLNFGASLRKTLQLDLKDAAFEKNLIILKSKWETSLMQLRDKIKEGITLVKINYLKDKSEDKKLSKQRLKEASNKIKESIKDCCKNTEIEEKVIDVEGGR